MLINRKQIPLRHETLFIIKSNVSLSVAEVWATETAIVPYVPPEVEGSTSLTQLLLSTDIGHGFVQSSEFEFLIDSLVGSQELVYPNLKRYFQQPLDRMHREIYVSKSWSKPFMQLKYQRQQFIAEILLNITTPE